jgi:polysaccharide biosynthesis protein PslG
VTNPRRQWAVLLLLSLSLVFPPQPSPGRAESADVDLTAASQDITSAIERDKRTPSRLASDTGYAVADDAFGTYYASRGGALTFGRPISRAFTFRGTEVQLFERGALKKMPDRSVTVLNLLDLLPYSPMDGNAIPPVDPAWVTTMPLANTRDFTAQATEYIQTWLFDTAKGLPVGFKTRYIETVPPWSYRNEPNGNARFLAAVELWGFPTSEVTLDPVRPGVAYQRFEKAVFVYDEAAGGTRVLPLGRYMQNILIGSFAMPDLAEQASTGPLWQQYQPRAANWMSRPGELPGTDLSAAFLPDAPPAGGASPSAVRAAAVKGPEYGMNIFVWDFPQFMDRDLGKIASAGFGWQKSLFQWRVIEPRKGEFDWENADRVVKASNAAGVKIIARVDFQPDWTRADGADHGPPDRYEDFGDFVYALVDHFAPGSPNGTIHAIELWNEPNLDRDWGGATINRGAAGDYVRLLCIGHEAAKRASRDIVTISAGLSPTGTTNGRAMDDVIYTEWMYDAGAKGCFDVLGVHGAGYKAPPWIGPQELAADKTWGGHSSFGFRRIEQLRDIMVRNGDGDRQVWLTEFGWSSDPIHQGYAWHRVTEEQKALYVVESYRWATLNWQPWVGVMVLWNLPAPDWTQEREEYWWAVANPDGTDRPAFEALAKARSVGYIP